MFDGELGAKGRSEKELKFRPVYCCTLLQLKLCGGGPEGGTLQRESVEVNLRSPLNLWCAACDQRAHTLVD